MKCPVCNLNMKLVGKDTSVDNKKKKQYERNFYWCDKDDVWTTVEIPLIKSN